MGLDEVIVMPRRVWKKMRNDGAPFSRVWREMRKFGRLVHEKKFDLVLDFQGNIKSGLVTRATKAPLRIGFARNETKEPNWLFTNKQLYLKGEVMHRMERDIRLLSMIGIESDFLSQF